MPSREPAPARTAAGAWWAIEVPDVPGVFSQAKRLEQVEPMIREALALMLNVPEDSVAVEVDFELPAGAEDALVAIARARRKAVEAENEFSRVLRSMTDSLTRSGLSYRDVGFLSGVSHQRVGQLVNAARPSAKKAPAKRAAVTKTTAKRPPAKRAAAKKTTAKKAPAKKKADERVAHAGKATKAVMRGGTFAHQTR